MRRAPRDEVAEGAQLVLLLGRDDEHPVGPAAAADRQGCPLPACDPCPGERAERDPPVAEQPQRPQQVAQHLAPALERVAGVLLLGRERDDQVARAVALAAARLRRQPVERLRSCDRQTGGERQLWRGDRQTAQACNDRDLGGGGQGGALQPLERRADAFLAQLEIGLLREHLAEQRPDRGAHARGRGQRRDVLADGDQVALEPLECRELPGDQLVLRQAFERGTSLGDELRGQGAVAVKRRSASAPAGLLVELERDLRSRGQLCRRAGRRPLPGSPSGRSASCTERMLSGLLPRRARSCRRVTTCSGRHRRRGGRFRLRLVRCRRAPVRRARCSPRRASLRRRSACHR